MADPQKLIFWASDKPALPGGDYTIQVTQQVHLAGSDKPGEVGTTTYPFAVAAPRFTLNPQDVLNVFPPPGSLGDYANALPHIQLRHSTLPYERVCAAQDDKGSPVDAPWLALLVVYDDEPYAPLQPGWKAGDLMEAQPPNGTILWCGLKPESGVEINPEDPVKVIEIDGATFANIFPKLEECILLTHVRSATDAQGLAESEPRAVIIANRLPKPGGSTTVHLVSLEGHMMNIDKQNAKAGQKVRLISLYNWRFSCTSPKLDLTGLLTSLNNTLLVQAVQANTDSNKLSQAVIPDAVTTALKQIGRPLGSTPVVTKDTIPGQWLIQDGLHNYSLIPENGTWRVLEKMPAVLRMPPVENGDAELHLQRGAAALGHRMRSGNRSVSWYHGPLIPADFAPPPIQLPAQNAAELLFYNANIGMQDVSYATAWELGRLLTLQNKPVAAALYTWKRQNAQAQKLLAIEHQLMHLPLGRTSLSGELPPIVLAFFKDLGLLAGVPFRYLVADERMLPPESLRFFQLDSMWVDCLIDGAFSIGRVLASDYRADAAAINHLNEQNLPNPTSGLLLRSAAVSGWPDLLLDAQASSGAIQPKRQEYLSANMLLCLYQEQIQSVTFHLKPEAFHFGLEGGLTVYKRTLRDSNGNQTGPSQEVKISGSRVVDWVDFQNRINARPLTSASATIAYQMVVEAPKIQYLVS